MKLNEITLTNPYLKLDKECYDKVAPTPLYKPHLIHVNKDVARTLEIDEDALESEDFLNLLNGTYKPKGFEPFAMCLFTCIRYGLYRGSTATLS